MRKTIVITVLALLFAMMPVWAAGEFTANSDITVADVTFGAGSVDMTILDGSTALSVSYSGGTFTVTNPGAAFNISCNENTVKAIQVKNSDGNTVACKKNDSAGSDYVTLPTTAGAYTIYPSSWNLPNTNSYNSYCGAATCESGYAVVGTGVDAVCDISGSGSGSGASSTGSSGLSAAPTTTAPTTTAPTTTAPTTTAPTTTDTVSTTPGVPAKDSAGKVTLEQMSTDATTIVSGNVNQVTAEMGVARNLTSEAEYNNTIVAKVVANASISTQARNTIINFVTYGTKATKTLGAGERAGVVNSFQAALGKLPTTADDWDDVIKIANGRWPTQRSTAAEERANVNFRKIYLRDPDRNNPHDDAAITVMAYGLRPADRNLNSEKTAIRTFRAIYGYDPSAATAWDVVRAIAYSGATR